MQMVSRCLRVLLCLLVVAGLAMSLGCRNTYSAERVRMRTYSMQTDADHIVDDVDWALGLDEPSILYEDSFPPHP
jgi:hypothetical protein